MSFILLGLWRVALAVSVQQRWILAQMFSGIRKHLVGTFATDHCKVEFQTSVQTSSLLRIAVPSLRPYRYDATPLAK